jgi:hypothetical protein
VVANSGVGVELNALKRPEKVAFPPTLAEQSSLEGLLGNRPLYSTAQNGFHLHNIQKFRGKNTRNSTLLNAFHQSNFPSFNSTFQNPRFLVFFVSMPQA